MELKDLVGVHQLRGVERGVINMNSDIWGRNELCNYISFCLDNTHYVCTEDPDDGYRSCMKNIEITNGPCKIFIPDTKVLCRMSDDEDEDILEMLDISNGKLVLRVGTDHNDDYYPCYIAEWIPENLGCNQKDYSNDRAREYYKIEKEKYFKEFRNLSTR